MPYDPAGTPDASIKSPTQLVWDYLAANNKLRGSGPTSDDVRAALEANARNPGTIVGLDSQAPAQSDPMTAAINKAVGGSGSALPVPPIPPGVGGPDQSNTASAPGEAPRGSGEPKTSSPPPNSAAVTPPPPGSPPNTSVFGTGGGVPGDAGPSAAEDWAKFTAALPQPATPPLAPPAAPPQNTSVYGTGGGSATSTLDLLKPLVAAILGGANAQTRPGFIPPNASAFDLNRRPPANPNEPKVILPGRRGDQPTSGGRFLQ